ncbi:hypothetical protein TPHA_0C02520 [Tetrapisispora phaffii CBS 4417]|uniref:PWWP domain-containing protein n=1 Tax=Tetrapisispora phaffii (strain ATCC 24235 / CBS 4417 / NBRC 1672 / NRRL Y-8282 / UCD 70-5) TaxID=1071381 RepID=G8BRM9_TETPH|nr:hypothetical protein TPHA_0C02520 [Tetrapisispora phaffii CBS 4417]CCE62405.1 hypothetical protein TPHA_0C02520 [Tetrapisispora phaffii CBS 4417]
MSTEYLYQPTDIVLAKVKGFSAWPAMIIPNELIPEAVLRNRMKMTSNSNNDANSIDEHDEQGEESDEDDYIIYSSLLKFQKFKTVKKLYCVKFLCDDTYYWVKPVDFHLLTVDECKDWLKTEKTKRRINKKLIPAYEMASKGSQNIDVMEFVEYGSYGKPEEDEYIDEVDEEEEEEYTTETSSSKSRKKGASKEKNPTRVSSRVSAKRKQEEIEEAKKKRNTRSNRAKVNEDTKDEEKMMLEETPVVSKKQTKSKNKDKQKKVQPELEKYNYDTDEDWSLVGLGPQDLSISQHENKLVSKLSQKKNLEIHKEKCLDIADKLSTINKLITDILIPNPDDATVGCSTTIQDYEVLIDELQLALQYNTRNDEFISIFQSNNEFLSNFRILINLQFEQLKKWNLLKDLNNIFRVIYKADLIIDTEPWNLQFESSKVIDEVTEPVEGSVTTESIKSE